MTVKFTAFNIELLQKSGEFLGVTSILIAFYGKKQFGWYRYPKTNMVKSTMMFFFIWSTGVWVSLLSFLQAGWPAMAFLWGETLQQKHEHRRFFLFFGVFLCSFHGCQQISYLELLVILSNQIWYFPGGYTFPPIIMTKSVKKSA